MTLHYTCNIVILTLKVYIRVEEAQRGSTLHAHLHTQASQLMEGRSCERGLRHEGRKVAPSPIVYPTKPEALAQHPLWHSTRCGRVAVANR